LRRPRRLSANEAVAGGLPETPPDPEVPDRPKRRRFAVEYKRKILKQADACRPDELGDLLRREGVYSSNLTAWRAARDRGELARLAGRRPNVSATQGVTDVIEPVGPAAITDGPRACDAERTWYRRCYLKWYPSRLKWFSSARSPRAAVATSV